MSRNHKYFIEEDANNEVDAIRAACYKMNADNLWLFAQRSVIAATEAQAIMAERFPKKWQEFDEQIMQKESDT